MVFNVIPSNLLVSLSLGTALYVVGKIVHNIYLHPLAHIPGPKVWSATRLPYIWALLRGTIVHDFERLHRKYGGILRVAPNEVTFAEPQAWIDIFQGRPGHQQFLKDPQWWAAPPGQPISIANAITPEAHTPIRKLLNPAFTTRALRQQDKILQVHTNLFIERLSELTREGDIDDGAVVDIAPWFNYLTFDIFGDLGFGESFDCLQKSQIHPWIAFIFEHVKAAAFLVMAGYYPPLKSLLMKCVPASLTKVQQDHFQLIVDKVDRRLNWEHVRPDIMSYVMQDTKAQNSVPMGEIHATFMLLTIAGSETGATALGGITNYLIRSTDKLALLQEEIRNTFSSADLITPETLQELPYLNAVINEGLRLCPPIPWILPRRVPAGGDTVCGVWLPAGTLVSIQAYTLQRDETYFHRANEFHPERWLPDSLNDPKSPFHSDQRQAVQPFSVGPRNCVGKPLALAEMRLALAKLIWTFDMKAVEGKRLRWEDLRTFLMVEKRPIEVNLRLRSVC